MLENAACFELVLLLLIFSQYRSSFAEGHGGHYLELSFTQYPSDVPVEGVSVAPPPLPSLDELLEIKLCDTYVVSTRLVCGATCLMFQ